MYKQKFNQLQQWFDNYVSNFQFNKEKDQQQIDLKYKHSYRVCQEIYYLSRKLNKDIIDQHIAKIIGLLHDVGRFEQYARYYTFSDSRSLDHAELGVKIIKDYRLLNDLDPVDRKIIIKAIRYHNKPLIPETNATSNNQVIFFSKLIRDADKLDIWNIFITRYEQEGNENIAMTLKNTDNITPYIFKKIKAREVVDYKHLKTCNDLKLMQLGWIYDINFTRTLQIIKERGYMEKIYNQISPSLQANIIYEEIMDYLDKSLASSNS